jgi:hypothetical protein
MSLDLSTVWFLLILVLPAFLLIAYLTVMMMDHHSKGDDDE